MTDTKDKAMTGLSEKERNLVEMLRSNLAKFDAGYHLLSLGQSEQSELLAIIDRLTASPPAPQAGEIERARAGETAHAIVAEHIDWMRNGRPKPTGGFPPEYFADELKEAIERAILAALGSAQALATHLANEYDGLGRCGECGAVHSPNTTCRTYADGIEDGWQPIETAPIGKTVLVCNPDEGEIPVVAKRYSTGWINVGEISVGNNSGRDFKLEPAPLYWMPLPSPPRALANKASG